MVNSLLFDSVIFAVKEEEDHYDVVLGLTGCPLIIPPNGLGHIEIRFSFKDERELIFIRDQINKVLQKEEQAA